METLQKIALVITIIGALNWGTIAIFDLDLVATAFGDMTLITRIIYGLVAICGIINIGILFEHFHER